MNHSGSDGVEERMEEEGLGNSGRRLDFKGCFCYGKMSEESPQNPAAHSPTLATPDEEQREKKLLFLSYCCRGWVLLFFLVAPHVLNGNAGWRGWVGAV